MYFAVSQTIPVVGAGIVLVGVIVLVVCFRYRYFAVSKPYRKKETANI